MNVAKQKEEDDSIPLSWRMKKPNAPSSPVPDRDQVRKAKGKEKESEQTEVVARNYTTKGTKKKNY